MNIDPTIEAEFQSLRPRYPELKSRVAVVTGGAKGIGLGIALRLAREGMRIVVGDKDAETLSSTTAALERLDIPFSAIVGDLSEPAAIRHLFAETRQIYGGIDLLVNNAANLDRESMLLSRCENHARDWQGRQHHPHFLGWRDQGALAGFSLRCYQGRD
jgi:NAD(P)-dependent dehydrogenase (short-subunit alcohol dehydrogenase family)